MPYKGFYLGPSGQLSTLQQALTGTLVANLRGQRQNGKFLASSKTTSYSRVEAR